MRARIADFTQSKGLLASGFLFVSALIFLVGAVIFNRTKDPPPVPVTMDFRILSDTVQYGEGLPFIVEYCNRTDETVTIERSVVMTEISRSPNKNVLYYANIDADIEPGCVEEPAATAPLPVTVGPGRWVIKHYVYTVPVKGEKRKVDVAEPEFEVAP